MAAFLYFSGCRLKSVITFAFFITNFMYCVCSRVSIENVDSWRLSLQMFSTANCGWLQGTGSITVRTCFPLKWRKKSLLWSLWTVQDTGKYIANSVYQRLCWLEKKTKPNPLCFLCLCNCKDGYLQLIHSLRNDVIICLAVYVLSLLETLRNVILPSLEWPHHYWGIVNFVAVQAFSF